MSKRSLPTETLQQIFSSNQEQQQLAILCRVSKRFNSIVKPFLYRSVTFQSIRQTDKFKESREEDVKLVEEVKIVGKGNPWRILEIQDLEWAYKAMNEAEKAEKESGVVKRLLEGEIVNPDQLKKLSIHGVVEDPNTLWSDGFSVNPRIFTNLTHLSIISHRGGLKVSSHFLQQAFIPHLQHLVLYESTQSARSQPASFNERGQPVDPGRAPYESRLLQATLERSNILQSSSLRLLVSPSFDFLDNCPSLIHLTALGFEFGVGYRCRYAILVSPKYWINTWTVEWVFDCLRDTARRFSEYSLRYLSLPSSLQGPLYVENQEVLDSLVAQGVAVFFDADDASGIPPPSFFEFRKKEEEEEEEEEESKKAIETLDR
ncbi:hypothetical protein JCM3765_004624 [Sporobolomyces pararoseus]